MSKIIQDEDFYGWAAHEIIQGTASQSLWAKAYALSNGDPDKTKAAYIRLRVPQLKEEAALLILETLNKEKQKAEAQKVAVENEAKLRQEKADRLRKIEAEEKKQSEEKRKAEQRRLEELEAQRAGEAWSRSESSIRMTDSWIIRPPEPPISKEDTSTQSAKDNTPPMSPEERDKLIEILKNAKDRKFKLF